MAVWTKRTTKSPTRGIRQTKTHSYGGKKVSKSTTSSSFKSGSTRVTRSVSSDGKLRKTITEHRPNGYSRRTTQTLVPANKPKVRKSSFPEQRKMKITTKTRNSSTRSSNNYSSAGYIPIDTGTFLFLCIGAALLLLFAYSAVLGFSVLVATIIGIIAVYAWPESKPKEVDEEKDNSWKWWSVICVSIWGLNYVFFM